MSRHPGTEHLMNLLKPNVSLSPGLFEISESFHVFAIELLNRVEDGPELTAGLRKILEAKDCIVRQALVDSQS